MRKGILLTALGIGLGALAASPAQAAIDAKIIIQPGIVIAPAQPVVEERVVVVERERPVVRKRVVVVERERRPGYKHGHRHGRGWDHGRDDEEVVFIRR
ncbi:MAG TPA: hypothetical protein V6D00_14485 [Pantanalinema sp.]